MDCFLIKGSKKICVFFNQGLIAALINIQCCCCLDGAKVSTAKVYLLILYALLDFTDGILNAVKDAKNFVAVEGVKGITDFLDSSDIGIVGLNYSFGSLKFRQVPTRHQLTQLLRVSTGIRHLFNFSHNISITDSIPFPSGFPDAPTQKRTEAKESFESYRELILENIDYDVLANDPHVDREQLDEIVDLVQETVCSTRSRIRVAGNDYSAEVVRSKLLKLNSEHIRFVTDCLKQNTTRIRNIRQYLLTVLFNAPSTMNSYYTALVAHDMLKTTTCTAA